MPPEAYRSALADLPRAVSFGYQRILVFQPHELDAMQVGYAVTPEGRSLIGEKAGMWRGNWIVIAHEEMCGDPIFIDATSAVFPVYTAIHGQGAWEPRQIATSLEGFARSLFAIARIAVGRENPSALGNNPLRKPEREATLTAIRSYISEADLEFWENLIS